MRLSLQRAEEFDADFDEQYRWYLEQAGEDLAERFPGAVLITLRFAVRLAQVRTAISFKSYISFKRFKERLSGGPPICDSCRRI